jgi:hypothetical protein
MGVVVSAPRSTITMSMSVEPAHVPDVVDPVPNAQAVRWLDHDVEPLVESRFQVGTVPPADGADGCAPLVEACANMTITSPL